jgi:formylglycine-generating enzyme required for sulfatase activity
MAEALKEAVDKPAAVEAGEPSVGYQKVEPLPVEKPAAIEPEAPVPVHPAFPWKWVVGIGGVGIVIALLLVWFGVIPGRAPTPTTTAAALVPTATHTTISATDAPLPTHTSTPKPVPTDTTTSTPTSTPGSTPPPTWTPVPSPPTSKAGDTQIREGDGAVMVYVPAGEFWMGSDDGLDDEKPRHRVYVDAFWIDRTEVTNAQYRKCVDAGACSLPSKSSSWTRDSYYGNPAFDNYPVIYVTWYQAQEYAGWVGGRLPTEAEWEYAARGSDAYAYPWGDNRPDGSLLNYDGSPGDTTEVGSYPDGGSWCGALDMSGNVYEWTSSVHKEYPYDSNDGRESLDSIDTRVLRGGAFYNESRYVRCAFRYRLTPGYGVFDLGFRCVLSPGLPSGL